MHSIRMREILGLAEVLRRWAKAKEYKACKKKDVFKVIKKAPRKNRT